MFAEETDAIYRLVGSIPGDRFGASVARAGDLDADGVDDLLVGSPRSSTGGLQTNGGVKVYSLASGVERFEIGGDSAFDQFGAAVAAAGDVNGDGIPDLLAASPGGDPSAGSVSVLSGVDGGVIQLMVGDSAGDAFGRSIAAAGDVDADGFPDWIVGAPDADIPAKSAGLARVFSGATGTVLFDLRGTAFIDRLGTAVAGAGDVDGDGHGDVMVGAPLADGGAFNGGEATVVSGASGVSLWSVWGTGPADQLGFWVAGVGDANGDGLSDVAVGAPGDDVGGVDAGSVSLLSGLSGVSIWTVAGDQVGAGLGPVSSVGDLDDDGLADVAMGAPHDSAGSVDGGAIWVRSGSTGAEIVRFAGPSPYGWLGVGLCGVGDVNGDGVADVAAGAPVHDDHVDLTSSAWVISGRALALSCDDHTLSLTTGGTRALSIDVGDAGANAPFALLGSMGGMAPGFPVAGVLLPLNPNDRYFMYTIANPNSPPLAGAYGVLDASGRAEASFALPAGLPASFVGVTVHHAFVAIGMGGPVGSQAVPITLIP